MRKRTNYLNNRDLMIEINKSKMSYCDLTDEKYAQYDIIVESFDDVSTPETIAAAKKKRADRLTSDAYLEYINNLKGKKTKKVADFRVEPEDIQDEDLTVRVITYEHIPESDRKKNPRTEADKYEKLNFTPYKHYALVEGKFVEVARSHWKDGEYNPDMGTMTDELAKMLMMLVKRYSARSNWCGYTYVDEMVGQALVHLVHMCLQFDEHKSENPFAYYTAAISNSFTRVLNNEKKNQNIRDDLLQEAGEMPSFTRQMDDDEFIRNQSDSYDEYR